MACLPVVGVSAYDVEVDGICYNLSNGEAAVTSKTPKYSGDIVIPSTIEYNNNTYQVTSIEGGAFYECIALTSVSIPESIEAIGNSAFAYCTSLTKITIPGGIVDDYVCRGCTSLTSATIGSKVSQIGAQPFGHCNLSNLIIEDGTTKLVFKTSDPFINTYSGGGSARQYIENVYWGRNVSSIYSSFEVFSGMTSLKTLTIGDKVTDIPSSLCYGCVNLTTVKFGAALTGISSNAFMFCSAISEISLPTSLQSIEGQAFYGCKGLMNVAIPQNVKSIGSYAFYECEGLTTASIQSETIGESAFLSCIALSSLTLGTRVKEIGQGAFNGCPISNISIPNNVLRIAGGAFGSIKELTIEDGDEPLDCYLSGMGPLEQVYLGRNVLEQSYGLGGIIRSSSTLCSLTIGEKVTHIPYAAFSNCSSLTTLTLGEGVTSIGESAFEGCSSLPSITLPNSLTTIGENAFYNATSLQTIVIPNSVTDIGESAFEDCSNLSTLDIQATSLTINSDWFIGCDNIATVSIAGGTIGEYAFRDKKKLTSLTLGEGVTSIGRYAFYGCSNLPSVTLPNSLTTIGESAFSNASSLQNIVIPNSVTEIGDYAFLNCSNLSTLDIQTTFLTVNSDWFSGCDNIATVSIAGGTIGESAFENRKKLTSLTLGEGVTSIGRYAFGGCSSLPSITLPNSLTTIGESAFCNTTSLQTISIPNSVTAIGSSAFYNSGALNAIHITDMAAWCGIAFGENWNGYSSDEGFNLYLNDEKVTSLLIPNEATKVNPLAFYNCKDIEHIVVEEGNEAYDSRNECNAIVETESNTLLKGCKNSFVPSDVTAIADYAFLNSDGLTSVTLGSGMQQIGQEAFYGCKLRNVLVKSTTPPVASGSSFSAQTFYHTTLYIPAGSWDDYAYDDSWYKFINIRETATTEAQLTMTQAYTLMDANKFCYSIYDPVNDCIGTISSVSGIDENNPNHCWQVVEYEGKHYLCNIGAKKFVVPSADGSGFTLSDKAASIDMEDGEDGIVMGEQPTRQWALVSNERMAVAQDVIDGITTGMQQTVLPQIYGDTRYYDLNGRQLQQPKKGLNIVRTADGRTIKTIRK